MTRRILPSGDRALLVELDDLDAVLALYRTLADTRPPGVLDLVPAARTIGGAAQAGDAPPLSRASPASPPAVACRNERLLSPAIVFSTSS